MVIGLGVSLVGVDPRERITPRSPSLFRPVLGQGSLSVRSIIIVQIGIKRQSIVGQTIDLAIGGRGADCPITVRRSRGVIFYGSGNSQWGMPSFSEGEDPRENLCSKVAAVRTLLDGGVPPKSGVGHRTRRRRVRSARRGAGVTGEGVGTGHEGGPGRASEAGAFVLWWLRVRSALGGGVAFLLGFEVGRAWLDTGSA